MSVAYGGPPGGYAPPPPTGRVDFSWLGQAWSLFTAQMGVWIGAFVLYALIASVLWLLWSIPTGIYATFHQLYLTIVNHAPPPVRPQNPYTEFARNQGFSLVVAAVNAVFLAGFYRMAIRQMRGEPISVGGAFSAFPQALPLAVVAVCVAGSVALLEGLLLGLLHLTGLPAAGAVSIAGVLVLIPSIVVQGLLMFAPLLILDKGVGAVDAILGSVRLLRGQWLMGVLFYFIAALIGGLGAALCLVGMLATYPLFLISIAVGYLALTQPPPAYPAGYPGQYPQAAPGVWPPPPGQQTPYGQPPSPSFGQSAPPPAAPPRRSLGGDLLDDAGGTPPSPNPPL